MHKTALQRYTTMFQQGAWLQIDHAGRKGQRCIMWRLPDGEVEAESLLLDEFRCLVSALNLRRVEQSAKVTWFVMRDAQTNHNR